MTAKRKRPTLEDRDAEALAAEVEPETVEPETEVAPKPEPEKKPEPTAKSRPATVSRLPKKEPVVKLAPKGKSQWPQMSPRIPPATFNAFQRISQIQRDELGKEPRQCLIEALDDWFLKHEPVDEYTEQLHARRGKRKRA